MSDPVTPPSEAPTKREVAIAQWIVEATDIERHDYAYVGVPRCEVCGRVLAAADCEPDVDLCWYALRGADRHCEFLRTPATGHSFPSLSRRDNKMRTSELHNVKPPVSGRVVSISISGRVVGPGEGLIEFSVPRHVAEAAALGGTWILSWHEPVEEGQQDAG